MPSATAHNDAPAMTEGLNPTADYADVADIFLTGRLGFPIRLIRVIRGSESSTVEFANKSSLWLMLWSLSPARLVCDDYKKPNKIDKRRSVSSHLCSPSIAKQAKVS